MPPARPWSPGCVPQPARGVVGRARGGTLFRSLLIPLIAITLAACGEGARNTSFRVALVTPGSIADASWNAGAWEGLAMIRDSLGVPVSHMEARTPAEQEEAMRTYARQGYPLIFAHGFEFQDAAERVSADYPDVVIAITSGQRVTGNVVPILFRFREPAYLGGMVAGAVTKTGRLGFIGGMELPPIRFAAQAWGNGARAVNPGVDVRATYLNTFDDAAAGREAALAMIRLGVDVFHHNADAAGLGVFRAATEYPAVYVVGANKDQTDLAPGRVLGSVIIDLPRAFLFIAREVQEGRFVPKEEMFDMASGVLYWMPNPALDSLLPAGFGERLRAAADSIMAGTLIPDAP